MDRLRAIAERERHSVSDQIIIAIEEHVRQKAGPHYGPAAGSLREATEATLREYERMMKRLAAKKTAVPVAKKERTKKR